MKLIKVLVLGVGGNVSQGIIKAIRNSKLNVEIVGACISSESIGLYMCDKAYISPYANDSNFISWLIELCNTEEIDIVLTGVEENICIIMQNYKKFSENTKALFKATEYNKLLIGQDKYLTCKWLENNYCNYPQYCKLEDNYSVEKLIANVGFPLIAKPRTGKGSKGVLKISSVEELDKVKSLSDYVLQEYIGNDKEEYTVGCYCDKKGKLMDIIIMKRTLVNGSTVYAKVMENPIIYEEAYKICNRFKPVGPLNIQLRLDKEEKPICFELNVRFSGTTPIRAHFGYCDVEAMIKEYILNENIDECFQIRNGEVYRYINELYLSEQATQCMSEFNIIKNLKLYKPCIEKLGDW